MKIKAKSSMFDHLMDEFMSSYLGADMIDDVISPRNTNKESIPLRYRIIAMGFLKKQDVEDVNNELLDNGCQPLYARSSFESTLIYAFSKHLDYHSWKRIVDACLETKSIWIQNNDSSEARQYLNEKRISLGDLEEYINANSAITDSRIVTKQITRVLDESIQNLGDDYTEFIRFYSSNLEHFSDVREKSRYYFCKYLYEYILAKIKRYQKEVGTNTPDKEQLLSLLPVKAETVLRRKNNNPDVLMDILSGCSISPGAIFEEFNYYYFEYVSLGWIDLLLENTDDINALNSRQIDEIAKYIVDCSNIDDGLKIGSNREIVSRYIEKIQSDEIVYQDNRRGETAIRKYLRGDIDFDRTSLICFLLFFGTDESNRNRIIITENRINEILDECGFSMLRKKNGFDRFIINYIKSKDPVSFLMNEMDEYLEKGESFYTFEVYSNSHSNAKEIRKCFNLP